MVAVFWCNSFYLVQKKASLHPLLYSEYTAFRLLSVTKILAPNLL